MAFSALLVVALDTQRIVECAVRHGELDVGGGKIDGRAAMFSECERDSKR